jgi:hypothetical protein
MRCSAVRVNGVVARICGPRRIHACVFCAEISSLECDFPIGKKTCDRKLCRRCAIAIAPNVDFCPDHPVPASQLVLDF